LNNQDAYKSIESAEMVRQNALYSEALLKVWQARGELSPLETSD